MTAARLLLAGALAASAFCSAGCLERRIRVTSEPPGALVWINDQEIGRTPTETAFTFYGSYDVRLELDGHATVQEERIASAPFYEWPGPDLIAEIIPARFQTEIHWHFDLQPTPERALPREQMEAELLDRARRLRARVEGEAPAPGE